MSNDAKNFAPISVDHQYQWGCASEGNHHMTEKPRSRSCQEWPVHVWDDTLNFLVDCDGVSHAGYCAGSLIVLSRGCQLLSSSYDDYLFIGLLCDTLWAQQILHFSRILPYISKLKCGICDSLHLILSEAWFLLWPEVGIQCNSKFSSKSFILQWDSIKKTV